MSAADDAYAEAERLIAEAKRTGAERLSLDRPATRALTRLPPGIAALDRLRELDLRNTQVADLTPLAGLTGITTLWLENIQVADLTPLAGLTGVTTLSLSATQVADLAPLAGLTGITELSLSATQVTDLAPLAPLTGITRLWLNNTQVADLAPLAGLTGVTSLWLNNTKVTDLASLSRMTGITTLGLFNTQVADLAPLAGLTGIMRLELGYTQVADLAPLAGLTEITALSLEYSAALDLRPLRGLRALVETPEIDGLTFKGTAAARADPRIAEIAEIRDPATRARTLFDYLETWVPPLAQSPANTNPNLPALPDPKPAPLEITVEHGRLVLAGGGSGLPSSDATTRAEQGWRALKDYRESFGESFNVGNYAPLPAVLKAFDRALGDAYDARRQIAMGMHGQRIIGLAFDAGFVVNLPTGAETELKGFAAAVSTFVNRFPDWLEYQAEAEAAEPAAASAVTERHAFQELENVIAEAETADDDVKAEYHDEVAAGTQTGASEVEAKGLLASTREVTRVLAESAMAEVRKGTKVRAYTSQMRRTGATELPKAGYWVGGIGFDMLWRMSPGLRRLSRRFPKQLGWVDAVLDYLFDRAQ